MNINVLTTINELISTLSYALDVEEEGKQYHGWRTAILTALLTDVMDVPYRRELFYAALLHDIGGIGVGHVPLHQFRRFRYDAPEEVIDHSSRSAEIVGKVPGLGGMKRALSEHHENWDGSGYPKGLRGGQISRAGQLLNLADYLDVSFREGRGLSRDEIIANIRTMENRFYSHEVVEQGCATFAMINAEQLAALKDLEGLPDIYSIFKDLIGVVVVPDRETVLEEVMEIFADVIDTKHPYTHGHSKRVADYGVRIGECMELDVDTVGRIRWAGWLHDIGKLCVPVDILNKDSDLSDGEYRVVKHHASYSYDLIGRITDLKPLAMAAAAHHERIDGRGYPFGLCGKEIPLEARVLCVADAFDALTSGRPYQEPLSRERIEGIFMRNRGKQFDARVVDAGLEVLFEQMTQYEGSQLLVCG